MTLVLKKKQGESNSAMLRRFSRLSQQTKLISTVKSKQAKNRKPSELTIKRRAMMSAALKKVRRNLQRMGKNDPDTFEEEKKKVKRTLAV